MAMTEFNGLLYSQNLHLMDRRWLVGRCSVFFYKSKENSKTSKELTKVISQMQSDWLEHRTSQSRVTYFY